MNAALVLWSILTVVLASATAARAEADLGQRATWTQPTAQQVKAEVEKWLSGHTLDDATRAKIDALWPAEGGAKPGTQMLEQLAATVALVDEQARELVVACRGQRRGVVVPQFELLSDETTPPLIRNNLRLLLARWLAQQRLYDESLEYIKDLGPDDVVDPASLLFYQSVAYHWLLDKENCLPRIARLLEQSDAIPRRYRAVAELMEADLKPLKADTLDEIARLMNDIRRRLQLARAGTKVRKQEDDVIAKLDKMIEELEKQRQQQQGSQGGGIPSQPMQDSMPGGNSGPGEVDPKKIGDRSGWGNLPAKERQEALQQIGRDFPSHYREVIEEYFRKLARDGAEE